MNQRLTIEHLSTVIMDQNTMPHAAIVMEPGTSCFVPYNTFYYMYHYYGLRHNIVMAHHTFRHLWAMFKDLADGGT